MAPIKAVGLRKVYQKGVRKKRVESLKGIDLEVGDGEIFGFVGPNGAGKSTTIKILMGLLKPTAGSAWLYNKPVRDPASRGSVGYLPENPSFYGYLSLLDLLSLVADIRGIGKREQKEQIPYLVELVGLEDAGKRQVKTFSKGMIQRAGIAVALVSDPDLLIFDEPMSGLDPFGRDLVAKLFRELQAKGKTIFFSTHILPDIEALCDRVGILVDGQLRYVGSVQDMLFSEEKTLEMTIRLPLGTEIEQVPFRGTSRILWKKENIYRLETNEEDLPYNIEEISCSGGSIIKIERKRRTFEELYKELASGNPK
ncbi:MAG: ABC transporter ATP-binding protein [Deltaproteobacteria bacterium]|nr:ABC transporter ATP-binding protein [Deltaproteobacteria bacterium]MBW2026949.1 ABC transporter ATP-binding protein [Deltaproteobacteria bacterium]MBW2126130.1 ABC transporter ATP-binding protein [Deltaproteobacteria bacterium]RLB20977.1 MAG: ABC transporter ATP-binding protein [Deltaproteobacteria bacterium]